MWQSCTGEVTEQSDLFRLTFATENLKDQGWNNQLMSDRDWRSGRFSASELNRNGFYVEKTALNAAYTEKGRQIKSVEFCVIGQVDAFLQTFTLYGLTAEKTSANSHYHTIMLMPPI